MNQVTASAPGKLMLLGEHAVVYGCPCIVTAVDLRVKVTIEFINNNEIIINSPNSVRNITLSELQQPHKYPRDTAFVEAAVENFFSSNNVRSGLNIKTEGPKTSYGLGSSSAVTAATIESLSKLFGLNLPKKQVFEQSYAAVLAVQGKGSGFDVASAIYGGTIYYKNGGEIIEEMEPIKLPIIIGYTGEKVSTINLIDHVAHLRSKHRTIIDGVFSVITETVNSAKLKLLNREWEDFGELININQGLLDSLGVNTEKIAKLIWSARSSGAFGAKISGAGGGDCIYVVIDPNKEKGIEESLKSAGAFLVPFSTNADGVRIEV